MGIPVLPVHDEVVFPENKQSDVEGILRETFKWTFNDAGDFGQITMKLTQSSMEQTSVKLKC